MPLVQAARRNDVRDEQDVTARLGGKPRLPGNDAVLNWSG